jgi:hypothetical protein
LNFEIPRIYDRQVNYQLAAESFFFEWVTVEVVAVLLPKTGLVMVHEFEAADPFDAFPGVEMRDDQAQWVAVIGGEGFAVVFEGEKGGGTEEVGKRDVGGVAVFGFDHDVGSAGADADAFEQVENRTPSQRTSNRLQRVTQCMSAVTGDRGRRENSSQVRRTRSSTMPEILKSQV